MLFSVAIHIGRQHYVSPSYILAEKALFCRHARRRYRAIWTVLSANSSLLKPKDACLPISVSLLISSLEIGRLNTISCARLNNFGSKPKVWKRNTTNEDWTPLYAPLSVAERALNGIQIQIALQHSGHATYWHWSWTGWGFFHLMLTQNALFPLRNALESENFFFLPTSC